MKNVKKVNTVKQKNINEIIGENIVNLLHINNISIQAACDTSRERFIHLSRQTLSKATKGETELTITQLLDICDFFGVSLDYIMGKTQYTNNDARAAGEYIGLSPESVETLHDNIDTNGAFCLEYLLRFHPQNTYIMLDTILRTFYNSSTANILNTLSQDQIEKYGKLLAGRSAQNEQLESDATITLLIKNAIAFLPNINPVHFCWFLLNMDYNRGVIPYDPNEDKDDFNNLLREYNATVAKKKRKLDRQQSI